MILTCPKCERRHDVSARRSGEVFDCPCGNVLEAPKRGGGLSGWVVLGIIGACTVPCIGMLAAIAIPNFFRYQDRSKAVEARTFLRAITVAEVAYFMEHDVFVAAGPVPAEVPRGTKEPFVPDDGFQKIGWMPDTPIRFQYQVRVSQDGRLAEVLARGDLRGKGEITTWRVVLGDENSSREPVEYGPGEELPPLAAGMPPPIARQQAPPQGSGAEVEVEASALLREMAIAEHEYFAEHGSLVAAGPVPKDVPRGGAVPFLTDEGFGELGWQPANLVRCQYQVVTARKGLVAELLARCDLEGDGKVTTLRKTIGAGSSEAVERFPPGAPIPGLQAEVPMPRRSEGPVGEGGFAFPSDQEGPREALVALARSQLAYQGSHGEFRAAGPVPASVPPPGEALPFEADDGFAMLGWAPPKAHYQYELRPSRDRRQVELLARGFEGGDSKPTTWRLVVGSGATLLEPVRFPPGAPLPRFPAARTRPANVPESEWQP